MANKELNDTIEELAKTFEDFKKANDERLEQLEKEGAVDPTLEEKLNKLEDRTAELQSQKDRLDEEVERLDEVEKKVNRPAYKDSDGNELSAEEREHKDAFEKFFKKGHDEGLRELEEKALSVGSDPDGGYAVPEELDRAIYSLQRESTPMRQICAVKRVSNENYKKLVNLHGAASGWVGETAARPETNSPTLAELTPSFGELYANPAATQKSLDDVFFDVEEWLSEEVGLEFAEQENAAFTSGDGSNKPKGFLDYPTATTADGTRAFGTLQTILTGVDGDYAASDPHNVFIDTVYSLKARHRNNARFVANRVGLKGVRKMKDGDGNLIWQPGLAAGQPQTLMGYPITENEDMPDIAAESLSIAFGDFMRGYQIVDVVGTRVLRDPYTNKPYVHFYTTKRVGGHVVDSEAIKLIQFGDNVA